MIEINKKLVQNLINEQFPQWKDLVIEPVAKSGHDNRTFHLGSKMTVRLPSGKGYAAQVEKELTWLPYLQKNLTMTISSPIAKGYPSCGYPFSWSINKYIEGDTLTKQNINNLNEFADDLAKFLKEFQKIDTTNGPQAGLHNYYRGGDLAVYHNETIEALENLKTVLPTELLLKIWQRALNASVSDLNVWVHGDIAPGNLLVKNGKLAAVIDFGVLGVGDSSCDYAMAWTFFEEESRQRFLKKLDQGMIDRACGWALWKALITYNSDEAERAENAQYTINEIIKDEKKLG